MDPVTLQGLLNALAEADTEALAALLAAENIDLAGLEAEALARFDEIRALDEPSEDDVAALEALAGGVEALRGEQGRRDELTADRQARIDALGTRVAPAADPDADPATDVDPPADPAADVDPAADPVADPDLEPVAAAAAVRGRRVDLAAISRRTGRPAVPLANDDRPVLLAAAGTGHEPGAELDMETAGRILEGRLAALPQRAGQPYSKTLAVQLRRPSLPAELTVDGGNVEDVLKFAGDQSRLPGGSLVAAGGWCAPSETVYGPFCELESSDGLLSLPEVNVRRGGLRWTLGPDFAALFAHTGYFHQTEAQAEAQTPKTCFEIPCPDFVEQRLEVDGICLQAGILQERGYPEIIARFISGTMTAHVHKMAALQIADIIAGSTPVAITAGIDATTVVLGAIELQVEDFRYAHRASRSLTLEMIAPFWLRGIIRSDIAKRRGIPDPMRVTDADIAAWFSLRGVSVQWVYNFDDAFANAGVGMGGAVPATAWPTTVRVILYSAGTWILGTQPIIDLGAVYSPELFKINQFNAVFSEEAWMVMKRCHDSRVVTIPVCPTGAVGAEATVVCPTV